MLDLTNPMMVSYQATVGATQLEYILRRRSEGVLVAVQLVTDKPARVLFVQADGTDAEEAVAYETTDDAIAAIKQHYDGLVVRYGAAEQA